MAMDDLVRRLGYGSYNQYLNSDHWKLFSNAMRESRCFCCGFNRLLQVHHVTYKNLGMELPTDIVTVCGRCHVAIHDACKSGKWKQATAHLALRKLKSKGGKRKRKSKRERKRQRKQAAIYRRLRQGHDELDDKLSLAISLDDD